MEAEEQVAVREQMTVREQVSIKTKVHMWWTWMRIAVRHVGQARGARAGDVTPQPPTRIIPVPPSRMSTRPQWSPSRPWGSPQRRSTWN